MKQRRGFSGIILIMVPVLVSLSSTYGGRAGLRAVKGELCRMEMQGGPEAGQVWERDFSG